MTTEATSFTILDALALVSSALAKTKAAKGNMGTPEAFASMEKEAAALVGSLPLMKAPLKKIRAEVRRAGKMANLLTDAVKSDRKDNIKRAEMWVERLEVLLERILADFALAGSKEAELVAESGLAAEPANDQAVADEPPPMTTDIAA